MNVGKLSAVDDEEREGKISVSIIVPGYVLTCKQKTTVFMVIIVV